jgi:hypothetical protein
MPGPLRITISPIHAQYTQETLIEQLRVPLRVIFIPCTIYGNRVGLLILIQRDTLGVV